MMRSSQPVSLGAGGALPPYPVVPVLTASRAISWTTNGSCPFGSTTMRIACIVFAPLGTEVCTTSNFGPSSTISTCLSRLTRTFPAAITTSRRPPESFATVSGRAAAEGSGREPHDLSALAHHEAMGAVGQHREPSRRGADLPPLAHDPALVEGRDGPRTSQHDVNETPGILDHAAGLVARSEGYGRHLASRVDDIDRVSIGIGRDDVPIAEHGERATGDRRGRQRRADRRAEVGVRDGGRRRARWAPRRCAPLGWHQRHQHHRLGAVRARGHGERGGEGGEGDGAATVHGHLFSIAHATLPSRENRGLFRARPGAPCATLHTPWGPCAPRKHEAPATDREGLVSSRR
jgi:hypothetical protein